MAFLTLTIGSSMPDFPVDVRAKDYVTDQGILARSLRVFVDIQIGPFGLLAS